MHLAVVFDSSFPAWQALHPTFSFTETIEALFIYLNAHLAFSTSNDVAVFAADQHGGTCIHHGTEVEEDPETDDSTAYPEHTNDDIIMTDEDLEKEENGKKMKKSEEEVFEHEKRMYRPFAKMDRKIINYFKRKAAQSKQDHSSANKTTGTLFFS